MITPKKSKASGTEIEHLPGDFLYVAGSDLYNRLNQPSQHMPYHLAVHLEHLDLVGYKRFNDGPPAPAYKRLENGIKNVIFHRVDIGKKGNTRTIALRRLRLPGSLDPRFQDLWLFANLWPYLKQQYLVGIIDGPESAILAYLLKKTGRIRHLIYYDIDFYPGQSPQWSEILSRREQNLCKMADAVASVSRPLSELRGRQGARLTKVIPNGVDFSRFYQSNSMREEHPPTLVYVGSLDKRWGIDLPIKAMPILRQFLPNIRLLIAGNGPATDELLLLAKDLGVANCVHFKGFVPYSDLPNLLAKGDIGIATSRDNAFRKYASPLKIVEYMAAGLPVICSGGGEAEQMIDESGAGINIPFTPEAFTDAVRTLLLTKSNLSVTQQAAINYAQSRSWEQMGNSMAKLVSQVAGMKYNPVKTDQEQAMKEDYA